MTTPRPIIHNLLCIVALAASLQAQAPPVTVRAIKLTAPLVVHRTGHGMAGCDSVKGRGIFHASHNVIARNTTSMMPKSTVTMR